MQVFSIAGVPPIFAAMRVSNRSPTGRLRLPAASFRKPGHVLTEAEIYRHCEHDLARYTHPRSVRFADARPRNAAGKVHKPTLRQRFGTA
jgi:acyl-CoA synthetase (AMP-forming)/AMP-acid ligase II